MHEENEWEFSSREGYVLHTRTRTGQKRCLLSALHFSEYQAPVLFLLSPSKNSFFFFFLNEMLRNLQAAGLTLKVQPRVAKTCREHR